ncbi:MAG TPA: NADP-dependent oxidoreductase [Candidatus Limnocylindria bacterium]|jgi:NADPH-dependent curcumin reductase CurA|nr:NADP-dependent oxidoreductase [Candidatus Limnocylindria bacterium]
MAPTNETFESREIRLASRPSGEPTGANFAMATTQVGPLGEGEILVRNTLVSVEPYMRGRMNDGPSYIPQFEIGEPLTGAAVGTVVASNAAEIPAGATVRHFWGWRDFAVLPGRAAQVLDVSRVGADAYLGALGTPGFTAWVGLRVIGRIQAGETLFVSGAAGAVGSMAVQLAKRAGLRVIGSAGSPAKVAYVRDELGADAAFDYHDGAAKKLRELAPDGIDVYYDNVGGEQLEAALGASREHGRVVLCGAISGYNATSAPPGPRNLFLAIARRLRLEGFIVTDHLAREPEFLAEALPLVADGTLKASTSFVDGLENAPGALIELLRSNASIGKIVVRL